MVAKYYRRETDEGRFRLLWISMARHGHCDAVGGMEYERCLKEWLDAGCPAPIYEFIQKAANRGPYDA